MKKALPLMAIQVIYLLVTPVFAAESDQNHSEAILQELTGINRSLEALVMLQQESVKQQKVDVLVRRLENEERTVLVIEPEMHRARKERDDVAAEVLQMRKSLDRPSEERLKEHIESSLVTLEQGLAWLDGRVEGLTAELDARRKVITELKRMVDEQIGLSQ